MNPDETTTPEERDARFALDCAHEAAAQGDYDLVDGVDPEESYTAARDAYRAATIRATLDRVRAVVEGMPSVTFHGAIMRDALLAALSDIRPEGT